ncbi:oligosaccharide flippase family protein [Clostridium sp. UBA1056]|uniref:oligosaccharide flippase family protein n=1 Tax=unclassified Clostridium TaxID=2614128 RepID=UPI00321657B5
MDKSVIKSALSKGLVEIFSASFINKIIQFGTIAILGRIISVSDYGNFSYAQNIMGMALLLEGLGITSGILQYSSIQKDHKEKYRFFNYGIKIGVVVNFLISIGLMIYATWGPLGIEDSRRYLFIMSFIPVLKIGYDAIQSYLRSSLRNKEYSRLTVFNTIIYFSATTVFSYFMGANGLILGIYVAYLLTVLLGAFFIKDDIFSYRGSTIKNKELKLEFLKFSIITILGNAMSQMLYLLDTQLVGIFTKDPALLANYKMATHIPFNLTFISISIMTFAYPYFAQNRDNKVWIKEKLSVLVKSLAVLNLIITVGGIVFAKPIFYILFGKKYLSAIPVFRVLMVGYFVSGTFRIPYGNVLASLGNAKANLINAIFSGVCNIILDIVLIIRFGSIGAAYATLIVFIISSVIYYIFIRRHMRKIEIN